MAQSLISTAVGCGPLNLKSSNGRSSDATQEQRGHWELIGRGHGIHWPDVDEDVSVRVLLGQPS